MLCPNMQVISPLLSPGELEEPCLVFLVFQEEELTEQARELSETCAEEEECLPQQRHGDDGTEKST